MQVLVITPAWNEESTIASVVDDVRRVGLDHLVVDDGSSDHTARCAIEAGARVVSLPINLGVGAALKCGFRYAIQNGYGAVVQVDADGQHLADEIGKLIERQSQTRAELVIGSRFARGHKSFEVSFARRLSMISLSRIASAATKSELTDVTSGFRMITGDLLKYFAHDFPNYYLGDTFEAVVTAGRRRFTVAETPVVMKERQAGIPSSSVPNSIAMILKALILVNLVPVRNEE